jgi:hypothetical protein
MNIRDQGRMMRRAIAKRWPEVKADLRWIVNSWLRPPDAAAGWEQYPDR